MKFRKRDSYSDRTCTEVRPAKCKIKFHRVSGRVLAVAQVNRHRMYDWGDK